MKKLSNEDTKKHIDSVDKVAKQSAKLIQKRKEGEKLGISSKRYIESRFHNYDK